MGDTNRFEDRTGQAVDPQSEYAPSFTLEVGRGLENPPVASVIVPVYNEASIISQNLRYLATYLGSPYEVIVCDDHSDDGTLSATLDVARQQPNIRLLRFNKRIGKGGTIKKAVELARGEVVVFMDADLSTDLKHFPTLLSRAFREDALVVSRRNTRDRLTQGAFRLVLSLGYNTIVRMFFRTGIKDHQCGFKAMKKEVAVKLMAQTLNNRFVFDTELIVLARRLGIPIKEVQVDWIDRRPRTANIKWMKAVAGMIKDVMILKLSSRTAIKL